MYAVSAALEASLLSVCVAQYTGQRPAGVWHSSTPSFAEEIYFMQNKGMVLETTGENEPNNILFLSELYIQYFTS